MHLQKFLISLLYNAKVEKTNKEIIKGNRSFLRKTLYKMAKQ